MVLFVSMSAIIAACSGVSPAPETTQPPPAVSTTGQPLHGGPSPSPVVQTTSRISTLKPGSTVTREASDCPGASGRCAPPTRTSAPTSPPTPIPTITLPAGRILFSSNRDGNWEIYLLDLNIGGGSAHFIKTYNVGDTTWQVYEPATALEAVNLSNNPANDNWPRWLPGSSELTFASDRRGEFVVDPDTGEKTPRNDWYLMRDDGSGVTILAAIAPSGTLPASSPSGQEIAYYTPAFQQQDQRIWITDQQGRIHRFLVQGYAPQWSPDGAWIAFLRYPHGIDDRTDSEVHLVRPDGSEEHRLLQNKDPIGEIAWSPDSRKIAFLSFGDIYIADIEEGIVRTLDIHFGGGVCTGWSPDGKWLVCEYEANLYEVHVERPWIVTLPGGAAENAENLSPSWGP